MKANSRQVGGTHYKDMSIEHWDVVALNGLDYFQGQITKYVMRWRGKNGLQDLDKAGHFLEKYIEVEKLRAEGRLTITILMNIVAKLELEEAKDQQLEHARSLNGDIVPGSDPSAQRERPARRVCPECVMVLPDHKEGCSLRNKVGAECTLCGGLATHKPQCPSQR